ncbi:uncharacterized protein NPIL_384811 [Nephila pilipes]|uniref:Spider venom protein n=1 Tax=Nephila pilipes TaxID=299642 RepID=A0A8X6MP94_NEPPI|nr:uncharacterized protein NPIL_384811 [Nephila pilipes]
MLKSIFILILVVALVTCQEEEGCGMFKRKCKENQYCYKVHPKSLGMCFYYFKKGSLCNDRILCEPHLECKEQKGVFIRFSICDDPSETTVAPTFTTDVKEEVTDTE